MALENIRLGEHDHLSSAWTLGLATSLVWRQLVQGPLSRPAASPM